MFAVRLSSAGKVAPGGPGLGWRVLILLFFHSSWVLMQAKRGINWKVSNKGSEIRWCHTVCPLLRSGVPDHVFIIWCMANEGYLTYREAGRILTESDCQLAFLESPEWIGFKWVTEAVFQKDPTPCGWGASDFRSARKSGRVSLHL